MGEVIEWSRDECEIALIDIVLAVNSHTGDDYKTMIAHPGCRKAFDRFIPLAEHERIVGELRGLIFAVLRQHDVSEQCFAEVAALTHQALERTKP